MIDILSFQWRRDHCVAGDESIKLAELLLVRKGNESADQREAAAWAAIAQAHYAAANVRAKLPSWPSPYGGSK